MIEQPTVELDRCESVRILRATVQTAALQSARELFQQRREWWLPVAAKLESREPHEIVIYRIHISRLTGRRASRDSRARNRG